MVLLQPQKNRSLRPVSVVGLGRVGLMTAFHLAEKGFPVHALDKDKELLEQLIKKQIPFREPSFENLLKKHHEKIKFSTSSKNTKYNFVSVPTPFSDLKQTIDLQALLDVLTKLSAGSFDTKYVFIRSTLAPGNSNTLQKQFQKLSIHYFPEFFREGHFVEDYQKTAFNVLGLPKDFQKGKKKDSVQLFSQFQFPQVEICSLEEAEILKSINNLFHGLKVSFANEVGRIAKTFQASPHKIMELFTKDTKLNVSKKYFKPGFSFGGPCLKKDIQILNSSQSDQQYFLPEYTNKSNQAHTQWLARQILNLGTKNLSVLGGSFTGSQTVDYRESEVIPLIDILSKSLLVYTVEKAFKKGIQKESFEQLLESELFILGSWTPLLKNKINLFSNYKGILFDLLIQDLPESLKKHPHYKNAYLY